MRLIGAEVTVMAKEPTYGHDYYGGKVSKLYVMDLDHSVISHP
jgi:hypothetical protein